MTIAPVSLAGGPEAGDADPVVAALAAAVGAAQDGDLFAPVTVVTPSAYAALFCRRALGATVWPDGRRGVANVTCTTLDQVVRHLGGPALAAQGLRPAPGPVGLEALRWQATGTPGWLADLASHPRGLRSLDSACTELRRCPAPTVAALARRTGRVGELARLVGAVRDHLHERGFADEVDLAQAATAAAASGEAARALGALVSVDLGALAPAHRAVLEALAPRTGERRGAVVAPSTPLFTEVRPCADPAEEVRTAVRAVVAALERGVPLWRQAVLHPPGPSYARALHQELASAESASQ